MRHERLHTGRVSMSLCTMQRNGTYQGLRIRCRHGPHNPGVLATIRNEQRQHVSARRVRKYAAEQQSKATSQGKELEGNIGSHQFVRRRCS
jgi:hypothetical protein